MEGSYHAQEECCFGGCKSSNCASSLWQLCLALLAWHLFAEGYWLSLQPCYALFSPSCIRLQEPGLWSAFGRAVPFARRACAQIMCPKHMRLCFQFTSQLQCYFTQEDTPYHPTKLAYPPRYPALPHCSYLYSIHHHQESLFCLLIAGFCFALLCFFLFPHWM